MKHIGLLFAGLWCCVTFSFEESATNTSIVGTSEQPRNISEQLEALLGQLEQLSAPLFTKEQDVGHLTSEDVEQLNELQDVFIQLAAGWCQSQYTQTRTYDHCLDALMEYLFETPRPLFLSYIDGSAMHVATAAELYRLDNGDYPESIEQMLSGYLQPLAQYANVQKHYTRASDDTEASWMDMRYYPPQAGSDTYTLVPDFPATGTPNIGRLRQRAQAVLPLLEALTTYYHVHSAYPEKITELYLDYLSDRYAVRNYLFHCRYSLYGDNGYRLSSGLNWNMELVYLVSGGIGRWKYHINDVPPRTLELDFDIPMSEPSQREGRKNEE
jgi:hypothetical protein